MSGTTRSRSHQAPSRSAGRRACDDHEIAFSEEDHGTQHSVYFSDPNGTVLEVTTPASAPELQPNAHAAQRVQRWIAARSGSGAAAQE